MTAIDDRQRGLYRKYDLYRIRADEKCGQTAELVTDPFFVLKYTTDPHAAAALCAYANSCEHDNPQLAAELREVLRGQPQDDRLSPYMIAAVDQGEAAVNESLDTVIKGYKSGRLYANRTGPSTDFILMSNWLRRQFFDRAANLDDGINAMADLLAVAVKRLTAHGTKQESGGDQ